MTPKSLLRHRECTSSLVDLQNGGFKCVLGDVPPRLKSQERQPTNVNAGAEKSRAKSSTKSRVLLCSGKIYYELQQRRRESPGDVAAIIRLEQFYPLPVADLRAALSPFAGNAIVVWVQEEPQNMGAWRFLRVNWDEHFNEFPLECVARPPAASPATGSKTAHEREQRHLIERAFNPSSTRK
jgi:2-oxoglutarate dehydrogenase E1 component